jgi:hypothetical protein
MNNILNSSNNELETLKNQGPFRIQRTDNASFDLNKTGETIINEPIIIEFEEVGYKKIIEKADEYNLNDWQDITEEK